MSSQQNGEWPVTFYRTKIDAERSRSGRLAPQIQGAIAWSRLDGRLTRYYWSGKHSSWLPVVPKRPASLARSHVPQYAYPEFLGPGAD